MYKVKNILKLLFLGIVLPIELSISAGGIFYKKPAIAEKDKLPLVFHPPYDITFFGVEKLHPFDSQK